MINDTQKIPDADEYRSVIVPGHKEIEIQNRVHSQFEFFLEVIELAREGRRTCGDFLWNINNKLDEG